MLDCYFIRHAPVVFPDGKDPIYGHEVVPINLECDEIIEDAICQLPNIKSIWISSPVDRAVKTARKFYSLYHKKEYINGIYTDESFAELNLGCAVGLEWNDFEKTEECKMFFDDIFNYRLKNAQTGNEVLSRISNQLLKYMKKENSHLPHIIFTHGGIIRFAAMLCGKTHFSSEGWHHYDTPFLSVHHFQFLNSTLKEMSFS